MRNKLNLFLIIATLLFISACGEEPANNEKEEDNELVAEESNEDEEQKNDSTEDENSNEDSQVETDKNETSEESDEKSKIASEIAEKINSIDFESPNNVNSDLAKFHTQTPEGIMVYEAHNILREEKLELYGIEGIVIERDVKHATNASSVSVETSDLITSEEEIKEIFGLIEDNTWDD
mgnify:CR=1 FL=1